MFPDGPVKTPSSEARRGPLPRTLGGTLASDQFLEVDPLSLGLRPERSSRLRAKVCDDDTKNERQISTYTAMKSCAYLTNSVNMTTPPIRL